MLQGRSDNELRRKSAAFRAVINLSFLTGRGAVGMDHFRPGAGRGVGASRTRQQHVLVEADSALPGDGDVDQHQRPCGFEHAMAMAGEVRWEHYLEGLRPVFGSCVGASGQRRMTSHTAQLKLCPP